MDSARTALEPASADGAQGTMFDALQRIAQDVNAGDVVEEVMQNLVRAVVAYAPWPAAWIRIYDTSSRQFLRVFQSGYSLEAVSTWDDWPIEGSPSQRVVETGEIVVVPDNRLFENYPFMVEVAGRDGFLSGIYVPVPVPGIPVVMGMSRRQPHEYSSAELGLARVIATFAALAIRNLLMRAEAVETERATNAELIRLNRTISWQNTDLQRITEVHERLLSVQLGRNGLERVCAALAELLHAPVVLLDRFHQLTATSPSVDPRTAADIVRAYTEHVEQGLGGGVSAGEGGVIDAGGRHLLIGTAVDENTVVGILIASWDSAQAADIDVRIMKQGGLHVALDVLRQRAVVEAEVRSHQDFAAALLADGDSAELARRASLLGIRLDVPAQALRARVSGVGPAANRHDSIELGELVQRRLRSTGHDAVVAAVSDVDLVVVLMSPPSVAGATRAPAAGVVREALVDGVVALHRIARREALVSIGIGSLGTGTEALRASHAEAVRTLEVMEVTARIGEDLAIADTGSYSLLAATSMRDRNGFVARYLGPLFAYERRQQGGGLVDTLRSYFASVGNIQRTAEVMFLHVSTVRYRLGRIEQIAAVSLRDQDDLLCLQLALRLAGLSEPSMGRDGR